MRGSEEQEGVGSLSESLLRSGNDGNSLQTGGLFFLPPPSTANCCKDVAALENEEEGGNKACAAVARLHIECWRSDGLSEERLLVTFLRPHQVP